MIEIIEPYFSPFFRFKNNYISQIHGRGVPLAEQLICSDLRIHQAEKRAETTPIVQTIDSRRSSLSQLHDDIVASRNLAKTGGTNRVANNIILIEEYMDVPLLEWKEEPLKWWRNRNRDGSLVPLSEVVKKYFCIPATSVPSEQIFSCAGNLLCEKRSRLTRDHVDMILFLFKNL